jgi:hypothetical protein
VRSADSKKETAAHFDASNQRKPLNDTQKLPTRLVNAKPSSPVRNPAYRKRWSIARFDGRCGGFTLMYRDRVSRMNRPRIAAARSAHRRITQMSAGRTTSPPIGKCSANALLAVGLGDGFVSSDDRNAEISSAKAKV